MQNDTFSGDIAPIVASIAMVAAGAAYLTMKINRNSKNDDGKSQKERPSTADTAGTAATDAAGGGVPAHTGELVAVLAAAIAAATDSDVSGIKVVSYRKTGQTAPIWNVKGRYDYLAGKL